jgi:hypothetical protein
VGNQILKIQEDLMNLLHLEELGICRIGPMFLGSMMTNCKYWKFKHGEI